MGPIMTAVSSYFPLGTLGKYFRWNSRRYKKWSHDKISWIDLVTENEVKIINEISILSLLIYPLFLAFCLVV